MSEPWLKNNHRLIVPLGIPALLVALLGLAGMVAGVVIWWPLVMVGGGLVLLALIYLALAWAYLRQPRLSHEPGYLLVHLGWGRTTKLPIEFVEVFFMGQAPSMVRGPEGQEAETATVVVRIADKAKQWHNREIPSYLAQWCDGYIILRGTWCEPIDMPLLDKLNRNLAEAHRRQKKTAKAEP